MNESDLVAAHYHMLTQCHERIEFDYLSNVQKGVAAPVVLLLDLRAPLAQAMCREVRTESSIQAHLHEAERRGVEPVVCWCLPATAAAGLLSGECPDIANQLTAIETSSAIPVVCVSAHGVSIARLPQA